MDQQDFISKFNEASSKNEVIVFLCHCHINYSGRVEANLADGDRIVVIKPDGNLLVHQPSGTNPINYMKQGSVHSINSADGKLFLSSKNSLLKDTLDMEIVKVYHIISHKLEDGQKILVAGSEYDMALMLIKNPELVEDGFRPLSQEEHTKYGFIDVFGHDKNNNLVIVECKRTVGDLKAVTQLRRYVEKMKELRGVQNIRGILACPKISDNALQMLRDWGFEYLAAEPPRYMEKYNAKQKKLDHF